MGCLKQAEKFIEPVADIGLALTGNAEFIPLANAGITGAEGVANGESIGKALGQGALAGGEALVGQEAAGALGIGTGNDFFNSTFGITGDNPAGTGLPDIGGAVSNAAGVSTPTTPTSVAPSSGGGFTSASSLLDSNTNPINNEFAEGLGSSGSTNLGDVAGTSTASSPGLGSGASNAIGASASSPLAAGQPGTFEGFASGGANIPGAVEPATAAFTPATASPSDSGSLLKTAEKAGIQSALPLGALAYDAIKGPAKLPSQASALESGGAATAPLLAMENQAANEANSGTLTPSQQATIQQGVKQQQNLLLQQLASSGVVNPTKDSRYIAGMQQIQEWAQSQQQAYISQAISEATSAGGAASQNIATVANDQIQNDTAFQDSLAAATAALGGSVGTNILNGTTKAA